ncbi:Uncharacterised protein [uncultured archaeon]|nr:Uncharacterised protein [uncultured archaeon]
MFENFTMSDFINLDETKTTSELTSTIQKLKGLKEELQEEILERWGEKFKSNIGGLYPFGEKLIDGIWIAFTQRTSKEYIPYPQLNIEISEEGFTVFFLLYGYGSPKLLNNKNRTISKPFYDNFVKNVRNNTELLISKKIHIKDSKLKFEDNYFNKSFSFKPSKITKMKKSEFIDLIFSRWDKLRPLYDMAMSDSYNFVNKEANNVDHTFGEVNPVLIKLLPSEIVKRESKKSDSNKSKKTDYAEENEKNQKTGKKGERLVFREEKKYLEKIGRMDLIKKLKHISNEDDSAGYDILSFDEKGNEKYIEVKSTTSKVSNVHHFNISSNEYEKGRKIKNYHIYFVFETNTKNPKIFPLERPFDLPETIIKVTPANYDVKIGLTKIKTQKIT